MKDNMVKKMEESITFTVKEKLMVLWSVTLSVITTILIFAIAVMLFVWQN